MFEIRTNQHPYRQQVSTHGMAFSLAEEIVRTHTGATRLMCYRNGPTLVVTDPDGKCAVEIHHAPRRLR